MKKFLTLFLVVILLWLPNPVLAADESDESQKTRIAGALLTDVMDLVLARYAGEEKLSPELLYEAALRGLMGELDIYSEYLNPKQLHTLTQGFSGSMYGIGVTLQMENDMPAINHVLAESPALKADVRKGDLLIKVNGANVSGLDLEEILDLISDKDVVTLNLKRGDEDIEKTITKAQIKLQSVYAMSFETLLKSAEKNDNSAIHYIYISDFGEETAAEFKKVITDLRANGVKGIAIDLRGNTGGYADSVIEICNMIVPEGPIMYTINKNNSRMLINSKLTDRPFEEIIVLTDSGTASASEVLASALQDAKAATVVGNTTYGKGVIQSIFELPYGGGLKLTTEEYLRRSGEKINDIGVIPDISLEELIEEYDSLYNESDLPLEKAYALLRD
ncbi:MAG: S41 family peptidase [Clostridiales bacterium]|jgi:carboxyl-terminal processing protease|nr:S41 family peptidase [Clostridiales bacterium]